MVWHMSKHKILVIEDNRDNFELVSFLLKRTGHDVIEASDGQAGLELVQNELPDLVLLDLAIPEIDGWEVARILKSDPKTAHIPLVALTAYTLPGDRRRAFEAGCDGYISKPINVANFSEEVDKYLNSTRQKT